VKLLDAESVFELHEHVLTRDGGLPGIRLGRSIDALLARIENNLHFEFDADPISAAALFAYTFSVGHIVNDAHKQTYYVSASMILELNEEDTRQIDQTTLEELIIAVASSELEIKGFGLAFRRLWQGLP